LITNQLLYQLSYAGAGNAGLYQARVSQSIAQAQAWRAFRKEPIGQATGGAPGHLQWFAEPGPR